VTLAAPAGMQVTAVTVSPAPATLPAGVRLPQGVIGFSLQGVPIGGSVSVRVIVHAGDEPIGYWKFGPTADNPTTHWYSFAFDGTTGGILVDSRTVQLQLVDGGRGDSDLTANGVIVDPGGPGGRVRFDLWLPRIDSSQDEPVKFSTGALSLWLPVVGR
jgi:hypothetical protein